MSVLHMHSITHTHTHYRVQELHIIRMAYVYSSACIHCTHMRTHLHTHYILTECQNCMYKAYRHSHTYTHVQLSESNSHPKDFSSAVHPIHSTHCGINLFECTGNLLPMASARLFATIDVSSRVHPKHLIWS